MPEFSTKLRVNYLPFFVCKVKKGKSFLFEVLMMSFGGSITLLAQFVLSIDRKNYINVLIIANCLLR